MNFLARRFGILMAGLKTYRRIAGVILAALVLFGSGLYVGYSHGPSIEKIAGIANKSADIPESRSVDFEPFWHAWRTIEEKYVATDKLNRQKMIWGAISGMTASLGDPYTTFFPPAEKKIFESEVRGNFEGVGMEIGMRKGIVTVIAPLKGTPAYKAGIKAGDKLLKIDDASTQDMTVDEAVQKIRGTGGTIVKLTVFRNGEDNTRVFSVTRDVIQIPVYETEKKSGGIFIIRLFSFSEKSPEAFRQALREFVASGSSKLIFDLRNNPGGYLEAAVDIASWFLPQNDVVVSEDYGHGNQTIHRSSGFELFKHLPLIVLVNGGSASASEIVAGALQDHGVAKLVGTKTFGKGSVQELIPITADTSLKVTIARWLTPNGHSISEKGLDPDVSVDAAKDTDTVLDPQLDKAIELLSHSQ